MRRSILCLLLALTLTLSGCAAAAAITAQEEKNCQLYYLVRDLEQAAGGDALGTESSALPKESADTLQTQVESLMNALLAGPSDPSLMSPFPEGTRLLKVELRGSHAMVDLSTAYRNLSGISLTLADYCITLTLTQLSAVRSVSILVRGQELSYRDSQRFRPRDVLLSSTEDVVATVEVLLYAIDPEGGLTAVPRTLDLYEGDTQAEALVRALRQGPWDKDWRSALPDWFSIQSVWLDDGVCYVNLLSSAVPEDADREEADLALRALQDSLSSLDSVQEVRILVNGEPAGVTPASSSAAPPDPTNAPQT